MRWQNLFDDLESQLETELGAEQVDLLAEEERLRLGRLSLRDRIRALHENGASPLGLTLRSGDRVALTLAAIGRDWLAGELDAGIQRSAIVPFAALATVDPARGQLVASLRADSTPEPPTALSARLGLAFVLRDLCRRRAAVEVHVGSERLHGTIDRVARDHLDLAEHAPGEPRRTAAVARMRIVAFAGLDLVRF
ncbi:MAG: hypothetical protein WBL06_02350 [Pseudolysinimonas sp.]|uniref:hypothetical protein n=1 Tax=Pseudolysinimonas sp. TaxID=2680009 RepID=UPI003C77ABAB